MKGKNRIKNYLTIERGLLGFTSGKIDILTITKKGVILVNKSSKIGGK
jgi:hypothetical protein